MAARNTMARYKRVFADIGRIGKDHGVQAVLEGSVRRDGQKLVVAVQLVDTRNGYHLWADRYERIAGHAAGVQSDVAGNVVSQVRRVVRARRAGESDKLHADPNTLDMYHRAEDLLRIPVLKNGPPGKLPDTVVEAVRLFRALTFQSPHFAKGWAGLAEAAEWEYEMRGNQPPERLAEAKATATRAVELAPDLRKAGWSSRPSCSTANGTSSARRRRAGAPSSWTRAIRAPGSATSISCERGRGRNRRCLKSIAPFNCNPRPPLFA